MNIKNLILYCKHIQWKRWITDSTFTILDQFFYSGSNFLLNILIARWTNPQDYGLFTFAFTILLFFSGFHTALLTEPMSVYGAKYKEKLKVYFLKSLKIHFLITLFMTALSLLAIIIFVGFGGNKSYIHTLVCMSVMMPLVLLTWFQRRFCYLNQSPKSALKISLFYSISLVIVISSIKMYTGVLYIYQVFIFVGIVSLTSGVLFRNNVSNYTISHKEDITTKDIFLENWKYGKWMFAVVLVQWLSGNFYILLTATFLNLADVGALKALHNTILPILQLITALCLFLIPWAARSINQKITNIKSRILMISVAFFIFASLYGAIVYLLKEQIFYLLYQNRYDQYKYLVPYFLMVPTLTSFSYGLQIGLKSFEKTNMIFKIYLVTAVTTLLIGSLLVYKMQILGVAIGSVFTSLVQLLITIYYWQKQISFYSTV